MDTSLNEQGWGRGRLIAILAGALLTALALVAGLVFAVVRALGGGVGDLAGSEPAAQEPQGEVVVDLAPGAPGRREAVATAPMLQVTPADAREGEVSSTAAPLVQIPAATETGPVGVPTGFPHTPEGAMAQLASIDVAVLRAMAVPTTHQIHQEWSTGGDPAQWVMTDNVAAFLSAAGQSGQTKPVGLSIVATPAAGQIKGSDGPDWVLACVLLDVRASLSHEGQMAYGHCEAMTWQEDRWVIDTSVQAAQAPSTWPGTDLAIQAGWRAWAPALPSHD